MFLFIGLGNKGSKYQNNRHNTGFLFIDYLVKKYGLLKINLILLEGTLLIKLNLILSSLLMKKKKLYKLILLLKHYKLMIK